jgi:hypothetical protein
MLHDLRSALEHLAWQLVIANGNQPIEQESKFPVLKVRPTANKQGVHPLPEIPGGAGPNARALLDDSQPYQFGAEYALHPLWQLDALWKIDKHRHVTVKGSRLDGLEIPPDTPRFRFHMERTSFDEDGARLRMVSDDPAVDVDCETMVRELVHEPGPGVDNVPLLKMLSDAQTFVTTVVMDAEDRCFQGSP